MEDFSIFRTVPVSTVENLLVDALEGGSNYWYMITKEIKPKQWTYYGEYNKDKTKFVHLIPFNGGTLFIDDSQADHPTLKKPVRLDRATLQKGLHCIQNILEMFLTIILTVTLPMFFYNAVF